MRECWILRRARLPRPRPRVPLLPPPRHLRPRLPLIGRPIAPDPAMLTRRAASSNHREIAQLHRRMGGGGGCGRVYTSRPQVGMWRLRGAGRAPLRLHGGAPSGPLRLGRAAVCTHDLGRAHYSPHGLASRCVLSCRYALWHPARQRINGTSQGRTSGLCASGQSRVSLGGLLYRREASRPTGRRAAGRQRAGKRGAEYDSAGRVQETSRLSLQAEM